jgi:hypothetical protein
MQNRWYSGLRIQKLGSGCGSFVEHLCDLRQV